MWWLPCLLLTTPFLVQCQEKKGPTEDEFRSMLDDAMVDVLSQQADEMARSYSPPLFNMPDNFMRSFRPGTGIGNREELIIDGISPLDVYSEGQFSSFLYKRFNHSDYIMGVSKSSLVLSKIDSSLKYVELSIDDAVTKYFDSAANIKDVVLFTRLTGRSETLFFAVLVESQKKYVVNVYEMFGNTAVVVAVIDLKIGNSNNFKTAEKLAYVQSSLGGSLVVLFKTFDESKLSYKQGGSSESNHYIEVNYPAAVDLVTFTIRGHGYIAVANHTFCDIFKMGETVKDHIHFDRFGPLSDIVDLEYFRIGFHHILAISDFSTTKLHTWQSGEFAVKQIIPVPDVRQVYASAVESCRDEVILLMVKTNGEVLIYAFNGQKESFEKINAAVPGGHLIAPGSMTSFTYSNRVVVLFLGWDAVPRALMIETKLKPLNDPLLAEGKLVSEIINRIQDTLDNQTKEINYIRNILKSAVRSSGNQHITDVQYFDDISTTKGAVVHEINKIVLEWEDSELTLDEYRTGAKQLEEDLTKLESLVGEIERVIPDLVLQNESAVIPGQKIFKGNVIADTLMAKSLNIRKVDDMDLQQIQKTIFRLDKPQKIDGTLTFAQPLTIDEDLTVDGKINGIDISEEVMTTNTKQTSHAQMVFNEKMTVRGELDLTGKINGIDISEEVITLHGNHQIMGNKEFLNGIEAENVNTTLLDGVYVDELYKTAFTISGNQNIPADATFSKITTNDIVLKGRLNGYDIQELEKNIVRTDKPANITGFKTFTNDVVVEGELTVKGTVNGLDIPNDLFLTDVSRPVTGTKEFLGVVTANIVNVTEKVDGINLPEDIVTLSGNDEISSTLYFADGIVAEQNIVVEGLVDGVDLSELTKQAMKMDDTHVFPHTVFLGPVNILGNLTVNGLVNNLDLKQIVDDIVYKNEYPVEIKAKKNFKKITADQVKLDAALNGYNISADFMKVNGDQIIKGTKTFESAVTLNSIVVEDGMIGGMNLSDIYRQRLSLIVEESEIEQDIEFVDHVIVYGDLKISGKVDGLKIPDDIVLRTSTQEISNKHFKDKVVVENLIVDGDIKVDNFGGKNLSQFFNDRITLSTDQTIPGDIWFGTASVDKMVISGLVNGININDFAENVMSKTKDQTITAVKEFSGGVAIHEPITTEEGVNGYNLSDLNRRAFKLQEDNIVTAIMQFEDNISFTDLKVNGDVNGVNVTQLVEDSLKKTGLQHVKGETVFDNGFHVVGDILASTVNGLNIQKDVLLKTGPQEITGQFTFQSAGIAGNLSIGKTINGMDLSEIAPKLARIDTETVIESDVTFSRPIHVHENIEVTGKVNEVDLKQLFANVLRKTGDQNITGNKVFRGNVTIVGDIDVNFINGINWKDFLKDVVWTNIPQHVRSPKTFQNDVAVEKDILVSGIAHVNLINGVNLREFLDEAVFIDTPTNISGPIIFKNPVEIAGDLNVDLINGLNLKTDVISIMCSDDGQYQVITGQKTFQKLKVFGDVYADSVNSYDLQELFKDTLLTEGKQTVEGHKIITGDVVFKKDVHPGVVNGMSLKTNLVTIDGAQEIDGPVTFQGDVFVEKDLITGLLNGIDLQKVSQDAVYLKTDQVIDGSYSFEKAEALSNVEVAGTVNEINLKTFDRNVTEFLKNTKDSLIMMEKFAQDHCELVNFLQDSLKNSYYALDNFVFHQEMESPASFIQVNSENEVCLLHLDDNAAMATSVKNIWNIKDQKFYPSNASATYVAKNLNYDVGNTHIIIKIGINGKDSLVVIQGIPAEVSSGFTDASVVVKNNMATVALLFPAKGTCDMYTIQQYDGTYQIKLENSLVIGKKASSIVLFEISNILYLAVSSSRMPSYYKGSSDIYAQVNGHWQKIQHIPIHSSSFVKHFTFHNYHYLAFASDAPVYKTKEAMSVQIFRNSGLNEFRLFQKVPFDGAKGMDFFHFGDLSQLHMVMWNETVIQIFALEGETGMQIKFSIHGKCVKDAKPLLLGKDLYLMVGQQDLMTGSSMKSILYKGIAKGVKYEPYDLMFC